MVRIKAGDPGPTFRLSEIIGHRDLLMTLAARDVRVRYKQTILGVLWVVLQPLMAALIFTFVFALLAGVRGDGRPYILVAFAGMLAWNLFSGVLLRSSNSLLSNAHLVTKMYFAREVLPLSAAPASMLDFAVALGVMAALLGWYAIWPGWPLLLLPVWTALIAALGLGLGLLAGSLMAR